MAMLVTAADFSRYRQIFYNKINRTPYYIQLEIFDKVEKPNPGTDEFSLESFVGDSKRNSNLYKFQALFVKEIPSRTREKYGLPDTVNGIVYLSPLQLVPKFGDYHLSKNRTKVHFEWGVQVIEKISYLEEMYKSCVGVEIFIKDDLKGG